MFSAMALKLLSYHRCVASSRQPQPDMQAHVDTADSLTLQFLRHCLVIVPVSELSAIFYKSRCLCRFKAKFDPIKQSEQQEVRNQEANEAAEAFAEQLSSSTLDPNAEEFNQGTG